MAALSMRKTMNTSSQRMDENRGPYALLEQKHDAHDHGQTLMLADDRMKETIHSGHFMMSNVPQDEEDESAEDGQQLALTEGNLPAAPQTQQMQMIPSSNNSRTRCNSDPARQDNGRLNITQRSKVIDSSLSKLFECMTLAYRAKLTSPKWNNFKGLKLRWTIKIRLNNVIWRAWHMQFVKQVRPLIAPFAIEVDLSTHNKQEAGPLLEGKYWKRKQSMVSAEYRRWRIWYRDRVNGAAAQNTTSQTMDGLESEFMERYGDYGVNTSNWMPQPSEEPMLVEDFNFLPDFTDALLAHLTNQPFAFPNPREIAQSGNADFIQPGLLQLQPSLDDFMDTLEPLQEFFANSGFGTVSTPSFSNNNQGGNYGYGTGGMGNSAGGRNDNLHQNSGNNLPVTDSYSNSTTGYWRPSLGMNEQANEVIQNRLNQLQQGGGNYITTTTNQRHVAPFQEKMNSINSYSNQSSPGAYMPTPSNPPYDPYGNAGSGSRHGVGGNPQTSIYGQQNSLYVPSAYPSVVSSLQNNSRSPLQSPSHDSLYDMRKEMKQRSLSGPTNGQPLIDPAVLGNLAANFNRSSSVSNGDLAYLQPKQEIMRAAAGANGPTKNPKKAAATVSFALPQTGTKVRRTSKATKTSQEPMMQLHTVPTIRMDSPYEYSAVSSQSSTLARLLTGGSPFANSMNTAQQPMQPSPPAPPRMPPSSKKLAPKPAVKSESSLKSGPPNINPFSMTSPMQSPVSQASSPSIINIDLTRQSADMTSKMEFTGSQDSARFRLKSEEPDLRNPRNMEHKRINHISAEQKRRGHIKSGFEILHGLVPSLAQNSSVKVSKAIVLHKGAEYIRQLKEERRTMQAEAETLKQQIEAINQAVIVCQQQLPATGAPVSSRARNDRMNDMLDDYVRQRTEQNWKFWLFSHIVRPLFDNFVANVSTRSIDDMSRSTSSWADQQCTLVQLRPLIKESMRKLSTTTHILSDPGRLPEEARQAVQKNPSSASTTPVQSHSRSSLVSHRTSRDS